MKETWLWLENNYETNNYEIDEFMNNCFIIKDITDRYEGGFVGNDKISIRRIAAGNEETLIDYPDEHIGMGVVVTTWLDDNKEYVCVVRADSEHTLVHGFRCLFSDYRHLAFKLKEKIV